MTNDNFKNLFLLLKVKGISQKEFSEIMGVSTSNVSDWKAGRAKPSLEMLIKIADYFDVSIDYLLGRKNELPNEIQLVKDLFILNNIFGLFLRKIDGNMYIMFDSMQIGTLLRLWREKLKTLSDDYYKEWVKNFPDFNIPHFEVTGQIKPKGYRTPKFDEETDSENIPCKPENISDDDKDFCLFQNCIPRI